MRHHPNHKNRFSLWLSGFFMLIYLSGCATPPSAGDPQWHPRNAEFELSDLVKSETNIVVETTLMAVMKELRNLAEKLYLRNPRELAKVNATGYGERLQQLFELEHDWKFAELNDHFGPEAIYLAFDDTYQGDRVFAFIAGLGYMIHASYEGKRSFNMFDQFPTFQDTLHPQKLYNCARNIEVAAWRLFNTRTAMGEPYLYSIHLGDAAEPPNLSFERTTGKLIALQDLMAQIMAQKSKRTIKQVFSFMASAVFLPI
ncbi:putative lipoprotein [Magnetococcus marinus MC-1]|uniref:Putative lipoprotein n=1 Tax=Magnetococcus marinus (strain ATCC BAA-1437 / JCM 17883 / MC-1) TaxID=156889 RepID=A0LC01_MAGMM|nr:hypothetical protein [Magnetococcus marinus]ABK45494.1 putative lipoprotein [Magnetococcus marinus MC-1]